MPWLKRKPSKLTRELGEFNDEVARGRLREAVAAVSVPAGSLIATRTGNVAHRKSALHPGASCEALSEWTDWRVVGSGEGLKPCHRCDLAVERQEAS